MSNAISRLLLRGALLALAASPAGATPFSRPPVRFEENAGQLDGAVRFVRRSGASSLLLLDRKAVVASEGARLELEFPGGLPVAPVGLEQEAGLTHHFVGSDPSAWVRDVRSFGRVVYPGLYPGVDLVFRAGGEGRVEFDFAVRPEGRPASIRLRIGGAGSADVDASGALVLGTDGGEVRIGRPSVYQEVSGKRRPVAGRFVRLGQRLFGFRVGRHDATRPLVIDPVLTTSTYFGGSTTDYGYAVAVGRTGNIYVAGTTYSANLPTVNAFQPANASPCCRDAYVSAFDPTGQRLIFSTFLGGAGSYDMAYALAVDPLGAVYVAGETHSVDFPVTPHAFQTAANYYAGADGFVTKLAPDGRSLVFSTYLAAESTSPSFERLNAIAVGPDLSVTVGGETDTPTWPVTAGAFQTTGCGSYDAFVTRLKPDGSGLVFSTYLCGTGFDSVAALTVLEDGSTVAVGQTASSDFPRMPASAGAFGGAMDGFVTKLDPTGSHLQLSRFLGGTGSDLALGVAIDGSGDLWVAGQTRSTDFPVRDAYQPHFAGGSKSCEGEVCPDAFLARLDPAGEIRMATYLGGTGEDIARGVAVSRTGAVAITGPTTSTNFPTLAPIQSSYRGLYDGFVAAFHPDGSPLFSTYLGGSERDQPYAVAFCRDDTLLVAGVTGSSNFPTRKPFQASLAGGFDDWDVFLTRIALEDPEAFVPIVLSSAGKNDSFFTSELAFANRGTSSLSLTLSYVPAPDMGGGGGSVTDTLPAGRQRIVPEALEYLRSLGLHIEATGNRGGTLRVRASGAADPSEFAVTARTTTQAANGRAGLAYVGVGSAERLSGVAYLAGLRQNAQDRSNVALQNLGGETEGDVTLRVTVVSGDPSAPVTHALPDRTLPPGGFLQITEVLRADGLSLAQGFVRVERVAGTAPYYAYAVVNDQANSDGSFVAPVAEADVLGVSGLTVPVVVETSTFSSELVLTNTSNASRHLHLVWVADGLWTADHATDLDLDLAPREQRIVPDFVQSLRAAGRPGIPPQGGSLAGALFVSPSTGDLGGVVIGTRTSAPGGGGRFGLFYSAVPFGRACTSAAWLFGLRQDGENRTNLALANTGESGTEADTFRVDLFDGASGALAGSASGIVVPARGFHQINSLLAAYAPGVTQGYARVVRTSGSNPFVSYAVVNDGAGPGERTGDGAFIVSISE